MAVHYRTQGFIISKDDFQEADRFFTVYTENFGKLEILGKAVRKIASKLRPQAELFNLSEIEFIQGKNYKTMTDASVIDSFKDVRQNLDKAKTGYKIVKTLNDLIKEEERDEKVWSLIAQSFRRLNDSENLKSEIIYHYFFWNLISILGYQIDLYHCLLCGRKLNPDKLYFILGEGIIDEECFKRFSDKGFKRIEPVSPEVIKVIRILTSHNCQTALRLKIKEDYLKCLDLISENYFDF
ncbi:MAG: DNA repair protein RecO [Candidatus Pacebacteria bacterium]|nr:DNA repair protein RecO [Candidatus Paceibacterota bacterium]